MHSSSVNNSQDIELFTRSHEMLFESSMMGNVPHFAFYLQSRALVEHNPLPIFSSRFLNGSQSGGRNTVAIALL